MRADLRWDGLLPVAGPDGARDAPAAQPQGPQPALAPPRVLDGPSGVQLWVFDLGLACCAVEFVAAAMRSDEWQHLGAAPTRRRQRAHVMVVSGTVTDRLAPAVLEAYSALPEPRYVLSFGACANSGGPYWDSYSVTKGADQLVPVDVYVPGCPPPPEALFDGLRRLLDRVRDD